MIKNLIKFWTKTNNQQTVRLFGLHIARTGGTSITDMASNLFGRESCLFLSSFSQTELMHELSPQERLSLSLPVFSFGHYVHESLWVALRNKGDITSFTLYREPLKRLQSIIRHYQISGVKEEVVHEQITACPNPWCEEILRCFPIVRLCFPDKPLHYQCRAALSLFDHVVPYEEIDMLPNILSLKSDTSQEQIRVKRLNAISMEEVPSFGMEFDIQKLLSDVQYSGPRF